MAAIATLHLASGPGLDGASGATMKALPEAVAAASSGHDLTAPGQQATAVQPDSAVVTSDSNRRSILTAPAGSGAVDHVCLWDLVAMVHPPRSTGWAQLAREHASEQWQFPTLVHAPEPALALALALVPEPVREHVPTHSLPPLLQQWLLWPVLLSVLSRR